MICTRGTSYTREYPYPIFYYPKNFFKRFRSCKLVFEHNTLETKEFLLERNYGLLLSELIFGKFLLQQSDAIVGVTDEITRYELKRTGDPTKPHITIGNGFEVDSVSVRNTRAYNNTELHLLCVANVSKWHGLDKLTERNGDIPGQYAYYIPYRWRRDGNSLTKTPG